MNIHVKLSEKASANAVIISQRSGRSVGDVVNTLMESLQAMEMEEVLTVKIERDPELVKPRESKIKTIRRANNWSVNL